jgi:hypothetical protein
MRQETGRGMLPYARGCFLPKQPVLLKGIPQGSYHLRASMGHDRPWLSCNVTSAFLGAQHER